MIPSGTRLYTWLDVEEVFLHLQDVGEWPSWLFTVRAYWDSLTLQVESGCRAQAEEWVRQTFDPRVVEIPFELFSAVAIALESREGQKRTLPVAVEELTERPRGTRSVPSLSRPAVLQSDSLGRLHPPPLNEESPQIFAFHSFKGGVGRTIHALALADAIGQKRVLLVDADLEAPGVSWLLESRFPDPPVSFCDLIALAHGDASPGRQEAIALVADRIREDIDGVFVLPAFRVGQRNQSVEIKPEDLLQGSADPFIMTDLMVRLARTLDLDAVVVDLRAGLSELSAGLLLDPRVQRILVTTLSGQSIRGTLSILNLLARRAPSTRESDPIPVVMLNQVPTELRGTGVLAAEEEKLFAAVAATARNDDDEDRDGLQGPTFFDPNLLALPSSWDEAMAAIRRAGVPETVRPLTASVPSRRPVLLQPPKLEESREFLQRVAGTLVYAETGEGEDFLPTSPLRRLATDYRQQLPVAVVVGAKGAGKTYTYLQVVRRKTWDEFTRHALETPSTMGALIVPLLAPKNLSAKAPELVRETRASAAERLGLVPPPTDEFLKDRIRDWLRLNLHEGEWRECWLDLIAWAVGYKSTEAAAGRALVDYLASRDQRVVVVIDGLEDIFQELPNNKAQQLALRSLLQDVPDWLGQHPTRVVGVLVFVRRDMVLNAIRQNSGQLLSRYEPYALKWDRVEALRLVAWVAARAGVLEIPAERIRQMSEEQLVDHLTPLWGRRLGTDKSREGRSAEWVVAALSDFRGQIQARDIVRFLHLAARHSAGAQSAWPDRILTPSGIRSAVAECSSEKIAEILQENPALGEILERLRALPENLRVVPFTQSEVSLSAEDLGLLELNGVVVADEARYYMPEIFRRGLNFRMKKGARPRVLALARRRS